MLPTVSAIGLITTLSYSSALSIVSSTIDSLNYIYHYLSTNSNNMVIKKYLHDIEYLDIQLKLELVNNWLTIGDTNQHVKTKSHHLIFDKIQDNTGKINKIITGIENKINIYNNSWFSYFYSLYLANEIQELEKQVKILDGRLIFIQLI